MNSVDHYTNKIPQNINSMVMNPMTQQEIEKLINEILNKSSHRHDEISNVLLKSLCSSISFPLYLIFNQSMSEGRFLDLMKRAEVVPLHKGKEFDRVINYRPISLLLTISKLIEKLVYTRVTKWYVNKNKIPCDS